MKKLLSLSILVFSVFTFFGISNASDTCKTITFPGGSVCLDINKNGNTYTLNRTINCPGGGCSLSCNILLPNSTLNEIGACNGSFVWSKKDIETVKIYAEFNGNRDDLIASYNFNLGQWSDAPIVSNTELSSFFLSTNERWPKTSQQVNLTIKAINNNEFTFTNYTNRVKFDVYYRNSENYNWTSAPSSTYTINSSWTNGYRFSSSDNGTKTLNNFIKFNTNNRHYMVRVYDENNSQIYNEIVFYVGNTSSTNYNLDNFLLSTNRGEPTTSQRANLTIKARNSNNNTITDFNERVRFKVYYRSSSSSSWTETTSSTYYNINSDYSNGYYFSSSDNGVKTLSNFIKFNRNNYDYKVRVYSDNNSNIYNEIVFYVGNTSSTNYNLDNFLLSTNRGEPTTSQRANLTIRARNSNNNTITNFNERVRFKVYYRSSSSSSWTETTSSTYYTINSDYSNGYYFSSSDNGVKTLSDFIKFNRNNYDYKVRVYSDNNSSIYNEIVFYVGNTSSNTTVNGFTVKEFEMVDRIYKIWPVLINQLKTEYPSFKTNTTWINQGNNLYKNMKDVLDDKSNRKFTNYNKFFTDFEERYSRTIDVIH